MLLGIMCFLDIRNFLKVKRELNRILLRIKGCNGDYLLYFLMIVCFFVGLSLGCLYW